MAETEATTTQAPPTPPIDTPELPVDFKDKDHDRADVEILYKIYVDKRLNSQAEFYKSRVRENQSNANFTFLVSTAVMSISALVAAVSAVISSPFFSLLSAILPALAALLAAFRQLYGWERQSSIYQDALMGLERVKLLTPDKDEMAAADLASIYPTLVAGGEQVFTGEVNQWGQFVQNADKTAADDSTDGKITDALMSDLRLSDDQIDTIRKIVAAGMPKAAFSDHTITVHPEETSALPAGEAQASAQSAPPAPATTPITVTTSHTGTTTLIPQDTVAAMSGSDATPATDQMAQSAPAAKTATTETEPIKVTTTRVETMTIHPVEDTNAFPAEDDTAASAQAASAASTPIAVTTTRVDTTVVEHHILASDLPTVEDTSAEAQTAAPIAEHEPPPQESMNALSPGAAHVDAPQAPPDDAEALASHHEIANEPPPPEAMSALTPGAMHVDAPQAPPENPDAPANPNDNG